MRAPAHPLRVLWLAKGLGRGGTEQLLCSSVGHIDRARFAVEVAYVLPWKDALVPTLEAEGVTVHCLDGAGPRTPTWPLRLRALVHDRQFALVHTHMPSTAVVARVVLGRAGPPLVHTEHNLWSRFRPTTRLTNALTFGRNRHVLAVSRAVADSICRPPLLPGSAWPPIDVAYQGIDVDRVRPAREGRAAARRTLGLAEHELVLGTVGNLTAKKDHRSLLDASAILADRHPDLRVVLIGLGPLADELRAHAVAIGLGERVLFTGMRDDVLDVLPAFDVFVLSSRYEGLPISLMEAMATGLACVSTSVGGVPEVVEDGVTGVLVPPGSARALADAISGLLSDPERRARLGDAAAATGRSHGIARAVAQLEGVYERVLGDGSL